MSQILRTWRADVGIGGQNAHFERPGPLTTSRPMLPRPRLPEGLAADLVAQEFFFSHLPLLVEAAGQP